MTTSPSSTHPDEQPEWAQYVPNWTTGEVIACGTGSGKSTPAGGITDAHDDPTGIDWAARQAAAEIWFDVVDGRPVNPLAPTGVPHGRGQLDHWGEALAADAVVTARTADGQRWLLLVERGDGHGWALPGGMVDPGEDPFATAERELAEETGLRLPDGVIREHWLPRVVPDPRASDEAWIVTRPMCVDLNGDGRYDFADQAALPAVTGADDAADARWWPANTYDQLLHSLREWRASSYDQLLASRREGLPVGRIFVAHEQLLRDVLDGPGEAATFLETYIDDQLAERSEQQLREMAADYLRLVAAIELTMADLSDWDDDELTEVERLTRYLGHLSQATRGVCDLCERVIYAPHATTGLLARRWWHPRRWRQAAVDAWNGLRYGTSRIAHTSCTQAIAVVDAAGRLRYPGQEIDRAGLGR
jgi:8-oxo-dGTP pyrophosphatase MutT (NUDIX family)